MYRTQKANVIWSHSWWQSKEDPRLFARVRGMGAINKEKGDDTYFVNWAPQGEMFLCSTPIDKFVKDYELYNGTGEYPKGVDFVSSQEIYYPGRDRSKIYV